MKTFKLHGNTANWQKGLSFNALNLNTLETEESSPIPSNKRMYVSVVSNVYKTGDETREVLKGEISESDKNELLSRIKNNTPDFILSLGGKVIGYANLHRRHGASAPTAAESEQQQPKAKVDIATIVDDNLCVIFAPIVGVGVGIVGESKTTEEDIKALAELKDKSQRERIAIINHDTHELFVEDIDLKVLNEKFLGSEEEYIDYFYRYGREGVSYSWDYITYAEYVPKGTPKDTEGVEIHFDELAD